MNRGPRPQRTNNSRRTQRQKPRRQEPRDTAPQAFRTSARRPEPTYRSAPDAHAKRAQTDPFSPKSAKTNRRPYSQGPAYPNYQKQSYPFAGTAQAQGFDYSAYSSADPYQEQDNNYNPYQNYQRPRNTLGGDPYDHLQESSDWTKWIVTVVSGIIFLACVIILIILLS